MFWTSDISELIKLNFTLNNNMTDEEKLNTLMRIILFFGILLALLTNKSNIMLFVIIILIISIFLYKYQNEIKQLNEDFFDKKKLKIIDNKICIAPTKNNPLMNSNIYDNSCYNNFDNCSINNKHVNDKINSILDNSMYKDTYNNIYGKNNLHLIFYTLPNNYSYTNQNKFANWLYRDHKTCKSDGGIECLNNIYSDIRVT
jgi:predicted Holliday junction resolvase-like endonuclease